MEKYVWIKGDEVIAEFNNIEQCDIEHFNKYQGCEGAPNVALEIDGKLIKEGDRIIVVAFKGTCSEVKTEVTVNKIFNGSLACKFDEPIVIGDNAFLDGTIPFRDIKTGWAELQIFRHQATENPIKDWDCLMGEMICQESSQYTFGHEQVDDIWEHLWRIVQDEECQRGGGVEIDWWEYVERYSSEEEAIEKLLKRASKYIVLLPVYAYIHSGVTISTGEFNCPWDSGMIGYIWVSKEETKERYNAKRMTPKVMAETVDDLENTVGMCNKYINNECYGFRIKDKEGGIIDSCYSFWGDDIEDVKEGMKYHVSDEHEHLFNSYEGSIEYEN